MVDGSPLEMIDPDHQVDIWEIVLYTMTLSFLAEGKHPRPKLNLARLN